MATPFDRILSSSLSLFFRSLDGKRASLFRGVSDVKEHKLIPSIARGWRGKLNGLKQLENEMLNNLIMRAPVLLDNPPANIWEWLMFGQHYGMPTRLLDWTANPLVALYFACCKDLEKDGGVYLSFGLSKIDPATNPDPFGVTTTYYLAPRHTSTRIVAQSAFFTISPDPLKALEVTHQVYSKGKAGFEESTSSIVIRGGENKFNILKELRKVGIGPATLFPGPDGLCEQIAMEYLYDKNEMDKIYQFNDLKIELDKRESHEEIATIYGQASTKRKGK